VRPLPVLGIVRDAYSFTFAHLGAIIAVIWLPMAVDIILGFFVEQRFFAAAQLAYAAHSTANEGGALLLFLLYAIAKMLLYAVMMVAVAQLALGTRQPSPMPVRFGRPEWRLFRAWFGLALFLLVPLLALMLAVGMTMPADPSALSGAQTSRLAFGVLVLMAAVLFVLLRFTFLLPGLAAGDAPERGLLARAWTLSTGHFWRIFAVIVLCAVPVYFCGAILEGVAEVATGVSQAPASDFAGTLMRTRETLPLSKGFQFLMAPFLIGLAASASVFALRELSRTDIIT